MFDRCSHPCDVAEVLINPFSDVIIVVGGEMMADVEIAVVTTTAVTFECARAACALDASGVVRNAITSGVVADICIGMLAEVTAGLEFALA